MWKDPAYALYRFEARPVKYCLKPLTKKNAYQRFLFQNNQFLYMAISRSTISWSSCSRCLNRRSTFRGCNMNVDLQLSDRMDAIHSYADGKLLAGRIGNVGILLINRPEKRNAMNLEMWMGVTDALDMFEADREIRVVVYAGAGGKSFTSGNDIGEFATRRQDAEANKEFMRVLSTGKEKLEVFPKPSVACIQGFCLGGGLATAVLADLRIAGSGAEFGVPAARLGIAYGASAMQHLIGLVGPSRARLMVYTARRFNASEALAMGLVDLVVPDSDIVRETISLAETIADNAPLSVLSAKVTIREMMKVPNMRDIASIEALTDKCINSADYLEGRTAFLERRKPEFRGT